MADGQPDAGQARWLEAFEATAMEPILRGFQDSGFQSEVARFVAERASAFTVCCVDGSHPLVWTSYHGEYRELFERQLNSIVQTNGLEEQEVHNFITFLHYNAKQIEVSYIYDGLQSGDINAFTDWLTSSEDYEAFLTVMFKEVRKQQSAQQEGLPPEQTVTQDLAPLTQTQELQVVVPEGYGPGQAIAVEYLGARYEVAIPEGCGPGMAFTVAVTVPA
eukprot:gnl/TRDRNA2_/TRDRNA2_55130_c0_seq1.p1 gnl/TRDRNA2_/TRDRNA2_55130_c0~~gnl/TRDRNA2_/TRDRNA2_55130_c0_seq1.p1  ORF type:complete len:219 (+),score=30.64 gnl/TRDRNA2_/TRDRNA2_55130_c0_seq1:100-756(+)